MSAQPSLLPINAAITLLNVDVAYDGQQILTNVNQQIRPRDFVVVIGPNGSGKSSLLRVIAGVQHPSRGAVLLGAHNLDDLDESDYHRQVMWIPSGENQIELMDEATRSSAPVLVIDEPRKEDECAVTFGILRLLRRRTIICASHSPDLVDQADVVFDLTTYAPNL